MKDDFLRILLVEPDLEDNGAIRVSLDRASRWANMGAEVTCLFVSNHASGPPVDVPSSLRTIIANKGLRSARWMLPNSLVRGLGAARRADVIVAGREIASGLLIGTLLAKLARRPLAVTIHSNVEAALSHHGTPRHRRNVLACLKAADLLVPVSSGLAPGLSAIGIRTERLQVVENGIDTGRLLRLSGDTPRAHVASRPYIMGLGRLSYEKGFDLLIRAHASALQKGAPPHDLVLVGQGPMLEDLASLAETLGVSGSVIFTGFLRNPYPTMANADVFVLSSRWEGFSLALAEAAALGVPMVAANCVAGPNEILDGGRLGDLVPVEDHDALAEAIAKHLRNPDRLNAMAANAALAANERYGANKAALKHLEALVSLGRSANQGDSVQVRGTC
ncbi:glycosyltransferase [Sphingomonas sp. BN140010]|uniref:Glycosyltransferase n=1 Tax=Sphingomonas arvum TaxID=2992113 RepID=A0ABT3JFN8_9SPHN|nr:glycosyltransferase [Sphingomonas sp. BN140010]MCW3797590.1 glycosyltransferase [Sphingomonas sp. BN140010]